MASESASEAQSTADNNSGGAGDAGGGGKGAGSGWFGHPPQLARLFTTEMWERFGYYGMRALLTIYLTKHFLFNDKTAAGIYGGFTALVYLTPLIGGLLADRYLGAKRSVKFGAIIMALGYFILCFGGESAKPYATIDNTRYEVELEGFEDGPSYTGLEKRYLVDDDGQRLLIGGRDDGTITFSNAEGEVVRTVEAERFASDGERSMWITMLLLVGLSMVTIGNGFFKPNISTIVGDLYEKGDRRRDSGFTIFYMGINVGALLSQFLCPWLADAVGWWAGFGLAAVGMAFSWFLVQFDGGRLDGYGEPPVTGNPDRALWIYLGALLTIPLFLFLLYNLMNASAVEPGEGIWGYVTSLPIMGQILFATFVSAIPIILFYTWKSGSKVELQMMIAAMVLIIFNVVFWTLFEQAGSSLTFFANRNTDLTIVGDISFNNGAQAQLFNPLFIIIFAPIMSLLWAMLAARNKEPSIPVKFGIALVGAGGGFLFLVWGTQFAGPDFKVAIWWLAGLYLIHSLAELCISPVGLSMITKLSMARIVGLMMGVWFLSIAIAQYVAGMIAQVASVETVGGQVTNLKVSLDTYAEVFTTIGWIAVGIGVVLLLLARPLRKLMHGVN